MSRRGLALAVGIALCVVAAPAAADLENPTPAQKQAFYAKPSVVRVVGFWEVSYRVGSKEIKEYVGGMGSGFFISADGFIATNAHVVEDIKNGEARAKAKALEQLLAKNAADLKTMEEDQVRELIAELRRVARAKANAEVVLPDGTKLPYEIRAYGAPVGQGQDVAIIKVATKDAPNLSIGDSDKVSVQDKVLAIGYPGAADMQGLLDSKSQLEATITDGAVSALKRTADGEPVLQVSVPITHGNSGGPAIGEKGEVIGLATFGSRGEVQGFNFLVASSTLKKFVKEAKADTTPSKSIVAWREGLDRMWEGDLDTATERFGEVKKLFATHVEAPRMLAHVAQMKKDGKGKPKQDAAGEGGDSSGAGIAVAIVVVLVIVLAIVVVVVKSKKKGAGHPAHGHPPAHPHPGTPHVPPPGPMVAGRAGPAPVAKTVAIGQQQHAPVAATAFGSLTMGALTCTRGLLLGQRFSLGPQGLLIGRQPGVAQIVVNDSRASGKHVWIGFEAGQLVAIDQGTTNGTFINDVRNGRISKAPLRDGDVVIVSEPDCLSLQIKLS